jgi:ribonuclease Z
MLYPEKICRYIGDRFHLIPISDGEEREIIGKRFEFFDIGSTKLTQFGFTVELDDGEKLTCCGDEPFRECERKYAEGSKWLLHEAFCLYAEADAFHPYEKHHSTVKDAAILASELGVKNLLLYHTEDKNIARRKELYTAEAKNFFEGEICVPNDLETIEL